jgi:hypothetical protein
VQEFLHEDPPTFYCADLSAIEGVSLFRTPEASVSFADERVEAIDWAAARVDITKEKPAPGGERSIFEWLEDRLLASQAEVIFCDDGSGEMADFISMSEADPGPRVAMFHCKKSGRPQPGNRVDDLYEVCGQAVKSCAWIKPELLLNQLQHRVNLRSIRGYIRGDGAAAARILALAGRQQVQFDVFIVQPGLLKEARGADLSNLLAATSHYLIDGGVDKFGAIGS